MLHLQIHLVQIKNKWEIFEVILSPFSFEGQICTMLHEKMFLAVGKNDLKIISGTSLNSCKKDEFLFYIPRFQSDSEFGSACALKLYAGATVAELNQHCSFQCRKPKAK